ncbi:MAG TPA: hypothetical protein VG937_30815 [Polyangiaceae bacterium]|nr:hypothetical protein [Polyangiaceae bacterium]
MRLLGFGLVTLLSVGCARGPNVISHDLPLKRVVVYRNGVGYFERAGRIDRETVGFEMRQRMVGDFLASLAVIERGGSSVRSASFPIEVEDASSPEPEEPAPMPLGKHSEPSDPPAPPPAKRPDPNRMREVLLQLDGKEHDLLIGYLSETPVWRPSYRVVVSSDGKAALQAWGIVQNLSGEDWNGVTLSLVAGAPLAFQSTLGTPVIPERPVVTDQGEVMAVVPTGVTSLDKSRESTGVDRYGPGEGYAAPAEAPAVQAIEEAEMEKDEEPSPERSRADLKKSRAVASAKATAGGAAPGRARAAAAGRALGSSMAPAPAAPPPPPSLSPPRRLSDLAAVALEAGTTRYDIPYPITVPNQSATMVLLTSQQVPGEAVLLYAPEPGVGESDAHPFRVARFTNSTPGLLERGPIAVFEQGSFLGQGMLEPLPPRATATVPFALERSVALTRDRREDQQGARLYRIEASRIWIERDSVTKTLYRVDNGGEKQVKLLLKHPRLGDSRLFKPPPGTEDNTGTGSALIPVELRAHSKTELTVDERRASQQETDWLGALADDAVRGYLKDPRANPDFARKLRDTWTIRDDLRKALDEFEKLSNERVELERSSEETRRNLKAIEKNPQAGDLRQKLTRRLAESGTRLDAISKRAIELQMGIDERQVRFRDAIHELRFDAPLPAKD